MATIPGVFFAQAERLGDREFMHHFTDGEWRAVTWAGAANLVRQIACGLITAGVERGTRVALMSENRFEWEMCDLAIQTVGAVTVPIYASSTARIVNHIASDSECRLAIASTEDIAKRFELRPPLQKVVLLDREVAEWINTPWDAKLRTEVAERLSGVDPQGVATVIYTSGTTGDPKGVVLTHHHFIDMAEDSLKVFALGPEDVLLSWLPYAHVMERLDGFFVPMSAGCSFWLARGMTTVVDDIGVARPTVMLGVPRIFDKVYEAVNDQVRKKGALQRALYAWAMDIGGQRVHGGRGPLLRLEGYLADRLVLRSLRTKLTGGRLRFFISGGAPLNEKVEGFFWSLGVKILQGWGLTEATSGATTNSETEHRYKSVGKPIPGTEIKVAKDGEILVKGPGVMAGYLNRPEETALMIADGWLQTGDMGFVDSDGYVFITDRKKDLIKTSGGKYVAPLPIEAQLQANRYVVSSMVVGDERPYVVALIVPDWQALATDHNITGDPERLVDDERVRDVFTHLVESVNSGLASFETIKRFALLPRDFSEAKDELTATLKPKRRVIASHFESVIDNMYAQPKASVAA